MGATIKIAIIGAGYMARIFSDNAHQLGIETHCFAWEKGAVAADFVDCFYPISIFEKDKILEKCKEIGISGVVSTTELTIPIAAYLAEKLNLNGISYDDAQNITNKYRNRICTENIPNLHHPRFALVSSKQDILDLKFKLPFILKPNNLGGKRGISVVKTISELESAIKYTFVGTNSGTCLIEEYLDGGIEYSVESLTYHGTSYIIQITEKISSGPPHCVELGHSQPACISKVLKKKIIETISEALEKIGVTNGPCHTEIKIIKDEIYLIEFNARPGGDHIAWPLVDLSTGFHYIQAAIKIACNDFTGVDYKKIKQRYAGVRFVTEQTSYLKPLFDVCEKFEWCYKKNEKHEDLTCLRNNDGYNTNYFIYSSDKPIDIDKINDDIC